MNSQFGWKKRLSELGLFCSAAIWGSTFFVVKSVLESVDAVVLVGYRFMLAAFFLAFFLLFKRTLSFKGLRHGLLLGFVLWLLYVSQTIGLNVTTASNSGFITGFFVAFVPLFQLLISKKNPAVNELVASCVSILGLYVLTGGLRDMNMGDCVTLIAAVTYAAHILLIDKYLKEGDDLFTLSFIQFSFVGAASLIPAAFLSLPFEVGEAATTIAILFLAFFPTLTAFVVQMAAQKYSEPVRVSLILALEPVFAALFAWTMGGEEIIVHRALGGLLIFLAIIISSFEGKALLKKRV